MIPASPIDGVREQIARAHWLVALAKEAKDHTSHFRFLIMAIYPARAAVEIMLDSGRSSGFQSIA